MILVSSTSKDFELSLVHDCIITKLLINPNENHLLTNLEALWLGWWSVFHDAGNSSDVTLAFEYTQGTSPFFREPTEDKDNTDDTDNTDDIDDTDYTDDIDYTDDTDNNNWLE